MSRTPVAHSAHLATFHLARELFQPCHILSADRVPSASSNSTETSAGSSHSDKLQLGAILGIVFGIVAFVLGMGVIFLVLRDRRRNERRETRVTRTASQTDGHSRGISMVSSQIAPLLLQTQHQRQSTEHPSMSQVSHSTGQGNPSSMVVGWHRPNPPATGTRHAEAQSRTHPQPEVPTGPPPSYDA